MFNRQKGFTLVELLAVIVVLAVIITTATTAVLNILGSAEGKIAEQNRKAIMDGALTYALGELNTEVCSEGFVPKNINDKDPNNKNCLTKITIEELINKAYIDDSASKCNKDAVLLIYNSYSKNVNGLDIGEYKVYAPEDICKG